MANILDLPDEIQVVIFRHYLETESQFNFLNRISNVCTKWKLLCKQSIFWKQIDGTISKHMLLTLCNRNILTNTEKVILGGSKKPYKLDELQKIFSSLPRLKSISFTNMSKLEKNVFTCLVKNCFEIYEVILADHPQNNHVASWYMMEDFLSTCGLNLTSLDMSYVTIQSSSAFLCKIATCCPNLEHLFLQSVKTPYSQFPIDEVKQGCPKLKTLRLGSPIIFKRSVKKEEMPGFLNLEIFTHPVTDSYKYSHRDLLCILSHSASLKILDVRGCLSITLNAILSLPATHLENIYLSMTPINQRDAMLLTNIFLKWCTSLHTVELSKMKFDSINDVLIDMVTMGKMKELKTLDLNNTNVASKAVIKIIENCENLISLNLSSCRNIGRGKMKEYRGKESILKLLDQLIIDVE